MSSDTTETADERLDVRNIDGEPFGDIMAALGSLPEGETLLLINSFEPEPLYDVIESRGFTYEATEVGSDEWHIEIEHA
ncbi:DUF2249 domain-containing protein [Halapricum hydrolyticum]|uniref:DUF2249 domain-containing protein n=1 Tax=Halapricum hydrolyticum TaxID=2979991 RepID=A0AAE3I8A4_9EURY|nr:DUF2249 domain-containing protein [Halapricum hydrolyticum]MCU4716940.1 DUF2249 domain-containing protein [Halapricum hydrolyticum]MCU4725455.1 DUF2249 domain-containing protein [Halapricum hydrolyticum]